MNNPNSYIDILNKVKRPSRYIGGEFNSTCDSGKTDTLKVLLAFPDTYEIGMSHLGLKILYYLLNSHERISAQRVFAPARDYTALLLEKGLPLLSLESKTPINQFDVIGFSLQYELSYTNVLNILTLGNIPLRSCHRSDNDPLIIAGGPCVFNPEPMADFIDAFIIGDAESALIEVCEKIIFAKNTDYSKNRILKLLAEIEGVYIPSLYNLKIEPGSNLKVIDKKSNAPYPVKRRIEFDLDKHGYPSCYPVPYCETVHDRINIEVSRGCNSGCRFCQAGIIYRPNRQRNPQGLVDIIRQSLLNSGLDEISLTSLDLSSYPNLEKFIGYLMGIFRNDKISMSLPSLRSNALTENLAKEIKSVKKTGFTLAPEAGTQKMRDMINKGIEEKDIIDATQFAYSQGWNLIKLYFMIGLPGETDSDILEIFELAKRVSKIGKIQSHKSGNINLSVSTFVPKPHTPFQWLAMDKLDTIRTKQLTLLDLAKKNKSIKLKWHDPKASILEAVMSRGDRDIGNAVELAYRNGALFDAWTDEIRFEVWLNAFDQLNIDIAKYIHREFPCDSLFPWSHIDTGVNIEYLKSELEKSRQGILTPACGQTECHSCGTCTPQYITKRVVPFDQVNDQTEQEETEEKTFFSFEGYYTKTGCLRFLSNRELLNTLVRAFRRAQIPIHHSYGFSPHPRFSFGPALPVGMSGLKEPLRFEITKNFDIPDLTEKLNASLPLEIRIFDIQQVPNNENNIGKKCKTAVYKVNHNFDESEKSRHQTVINSITNCDSLIYIKKTGSGEKEINLKDGIISITMDCESLYLHLSDTVRVHDVLDKIFPGRFKVNEITRLFFEEQS